MSVDIVFPLEFIVEGVPVSQQARYQSDWKSKVAEAARRNLQPGHWAAEEPVHVTIFYFPDGRMLGDIDNIVKPILDALNRIVYMDDAQVERIVVQRFEANRISSISHPSGCLADALERAKPIVYVRIDEAERREEG